MSDPTASEEWRRILNGEIPGLRTFQRILKKIPSEPRCKLCYAPFGKPGIHLGALVFQQARIGGLDDRIELQCIGQAGYRDVVGAGGIEVADAGQEIGGRHDLGIRIEGTDVADQLFVAGADEQ